MFRTRNGWLSGRSAMRGLLVAGMMFAVRAGADDCAARLARVKAVADGLCTVTNVATMPKRGGVVRVDFVLKAEPGSDIRCRVEMAPPERWDGRLWGIGNSGTAGKVPSLERFVGEDSAAVTTDLGTWSVTDCGTRDTNIWPKAVSRDYSWRATHLMTVYGKRFVAAYYGKAPDKSYFCGGSCGGRQAFSEAVRFPADYDGIISYLPAHNTMANNMAKWNLWRQTHGADGQLLFSTEEMRIVADAAIEFRKTKDPAPYAGRFLADGRTTGEEVDAILALAAKRAPSLAQGDKLARLKAIYTPSYFEGECLALNYAPSSYLGKRMGSRMMAGLRVWMKERGLPPEFGPHVTWERMRAFAHDAAPEGNANGTDLSAFFARGGKMIVTTGWEDQTVSPYPIVEHYERICAQQGGLERTMESCRLFCMPGGAHGGGKGRAFTGGPGQGENVRQAMVAWREKGVAPDKLDIKTYHDGVIPLATYPGLFVRESSGGWRRVETPRTKPQLADFLFVCDPHPVRWKGVGD